MSVKCKAIGKITNKKNETIGYKLIDTVGNIMDVPSKQIKNAISSGQIQCVNLKITSDNRLIISEEKEDKFSYKDEPIHAIYYYKDILPRSLYNGNKKYDKPKVTLWFNITDNNIDAYKKFIDKAYFGYYGEITKGIFIETLDYARTLECIRNGLIVLDNAEVEFYDKDDIEYKLRQLKKYGHYGSAEIKQYEIIYSYGAVDMTPRVKDVSIPEITEDTVWNVLNIIHQKVQTVIPKPVPPKKSKDFRFDSIKLSNEYNDAFNKYCDLFGATMVAYMWYNLNDTQILQLHNKLNSMMYEIYNSNNPRFSVYNRWLPYGDDTFQDSVMFIIMYYGKEVFDTFRKTTRKDDLRALGVDFNNITDNAESFRYLASSYIRND